MIETKLKLIKKSLSRDGSVGLRLEGKSMEPLIQHGVHVVINSANQDDIKISDIVAFEKDSNLVVHQCLYKGKRHMVTWGINNNFVDRKVDYKEILGKVSLPINTNLYNRWLFLEATKLNRGLKKIKTNPIWMKGPIYNMYLYGYFLNFKTSDLDILIDRKKFSKVRKYLEKCGYTMEKKSASSVSDLPYAEISFEKKTGDLKTKLDIHLLAVRCTFRNFFPRPFEPRRMVLISDELIKRPIMYMGFRMLDDTSSLFYLCVNLVLHHAGKGVDDLARIAQLIDRGTINWKKFERLSYKYDLDGYVYYPLNWSRNLFGVNIPMIRRLKPSWFRHTLVRLLLNRRTICRHNRLITWFDQRINVAQILYLRVVLSIFTRKLGTMYLHSQEVRIYSKI